MDGVSLSIRKILAVVALFGPAVGCFHFGVHRQRLANRPLCMTADDAFQLKVTYDGMTCNLDIGKDETILAALERSELVTRGLSLPELPSDCRRGNCMTCAAQHHEESKSDNLDQRENGLTPTVAEALREKGLVLTCSSFVLGNGVHLELGENDQAWQEVYRARLEDEDTQRVAREAMARVIRRTAEKNVDSWKEETEEVYERSGE